MTKKEGLYVSYNEEKNGDFDEAVRISKERGCVTWFDTFSLKPERLDCPTDVFVRAFVKTTGQERYFRGRLLAVASEETLNMKKADFAEGERNHRPKPWWQNKDFQSVLFISHLKPEDSKPRELEDKEPPQHPIYVNL
jgi:hypothetical protein